jgi:enamine deaminase RidA (YjgF/YER057c/UK114 family)
MTFAPGPTASDPISPLRAQRVTAADWAGALHSQALGGLGYGMASDGAALGGLPVPVLGGAACVDAWLGLGTWQEGCSGAVRWRHDGHWLHGVLDIADAGTDLAAAAEQAYRDVFATLQDSGFAHLLRLWNYLPRINAETGGLERYRQFNIGRQQAFLTAGQRAFEGAPAACAIGTGSGTGAGDLCVRFLAGRAAPVAVENPRQVSAYRYPRTYGPRAPTFSRAALASLGGGDVALFVSGTASIVGHETCHPGDLQAQTLETLNNLRAVLAAAQLRCSAPLQLADLVPCVYVRHAQDQPAVTQVLDAAWGAGSLAARTAVYVQADICRADLLVEVEGHITVSGQVLP